MKTFRMGRNTSEHYSSFEELGKAWGCKPVNKRTKDEEKLKKQRENFCARHKCEACGEPMQWITGSVMTCTNEKCKGKKIERTDAEGNKIVSYITSYELLDGTGSEIAYNIFSESE